MPLLISTKLRGPQIRPISYVLINPTPPPTFTWVTDPTMATNFATHDLANQYRQDNPDLLVISQNYTLP